jgi:hypothetical protein
MSCSRRDCASLRSLPMIDWYSRRTCQTALSLAPSGADSSSSARAVRAISDSETISTVPSRDRCRRPAAMAAKSCSPLVWPIRTKYSCPTGGGG